jgi:hypothetical protein
MALPEWVKLPTQWIQDGGLGKFRWTKGEGSNYTAALMVLMGIAHHADTETGVTRLTYDDLEKITILSRSKISVGLKILENQEIIHRPEKRSTGITLNNYNPYQGWGKLPTKRLYRHGFISLFSDFKLRNPTELNALKIYLLLVTRRDNASNLANISYDKIEEYSAIDRSKIKSAISVLTLNGLIQVEQVPSEYGVSNAYRLSFLDTRNHMGTQGRRLMQDEAGLIKLTGEREF